ncbi:TPA: LicD family protein, partial [Haemophilus influenzae]
WIRASQNSLKYTILNWLSNLLFHRMQNYLSEIQKLHPINTSENIGLLMTEYRNWNKAYMPRAYFNHVIYKEFEGRQFQVMNGYHEHLTQYYGDYMKLPPEEEQKPHHIQEAYIL